MADTYGTDGHGVAVFNPVPRDVEGELIYTQVSKPLTVPDMKVTAVLSRLPRWDVINILPGSQSGWFLCVQANLSDKSCYRVEILNNRCQFEQVDAVGNHTDIGGKKTIPANALGIPYALEIKGNTLTLTRNGIVAATQAVTAPLTGRHVGFGAYKVAYVGPEPCAEFAGVAWQPA